MKAEKITLNNESLTIKQWSEKIGWCPKTIRRRLSIPGLSLEKALSSEKLYQKDYGTLKWKYSTYTKTYSAWKGMRKRCTSNSKNKNYKNYYSRGIFICERWINNYNAFYEDMGDVPDNMTLDRIDNTKGYEPSNCRWATRSIQQRNKRTSVLITYNNETKNLVDWAEITNINPTVISRRYKKGYPIEKVLSPKRVNGRK